jgi:hypothetical protein
MAMSACRRRRIVAVLLGQLTDVADREAGQLGDALDADAGGAQSGDVVADGGGVHVGLPAAVDPFPGGSAAGGGVGGGALRATTAVLNVAGAGAVPVAGLRIGALAHRTGLKSLGSATGLLEAAPVLRTGLPPMVRVGESGTGVVGVVAAGRAGAADPHRRLGCRDGPDLPMLRRVRPGTPAR